MPRNRGDCICSSSSRSVSAMGSLGTMPPTIASGCPVASASSSSSAVSSPEYGAVAAATCTNFTTFQFADSEKYVGWSKRRHIPETSPMSSSRWPARYGYQSARAGSQRWMCASTMRSMGADIAPPRRRVLEVARTRPVTMSRSAPSSQPGTAGPPNEIVPPGRGWLRRPNQSASATSSAPDSAPASAPLTR